jgi:integrase
MSALPDLLPTQTLSYDSTAASSPAVLVHGFSQDVVGAAAVALSRLLGERRDRKGGDIYELNRMLARYADLAAETNGSIAVPPAPAHHPTSVLRKLGLLRSDLNAEWNRRVAQDGMRATFDTDLLLALFPLGCFGALCAIIVDGPGLAVDRIERVLHRRSLEPVRPTRARADGGLVSSATLNASVASLRWLLYQLNDLQRRQFPCPPLEQWQGVPKIRLPRAEPANTDRSAPPRILLRRTYAALDHEVKRRLGVEHDVDEDPRVRTMGRTKMRICGVWRLARNRAILGLLISLGGRRAAICDLTRGDVNRDHLGPDGHLGPAIALRPGKVHHEQAIHWKPIPTDLLRTIDIYLLLTDTLITETETECRPERSNGRRRQPAPGPDAPLFIGALKYPKRALGAASLYQTLVGHRGYPKHNRKPRAPLIPRGDGSGFSPHSLRRAALQATRIAATDYCRSNECPVTPEGISAALLDQIMPSDRYGYADVNTPAGRETWSRLAIELNWQMLTGDRGARKAVDQERITACQQQVKWLHAEAVQQQRSIDDALAQAQRTRLTAETGVLVHRATDRKAEIRAEVDKLEREIDRLWHDPAARIPVPDDVPDDHLRMSQQPPSPTHDVIEHEEQPVRDFFTGPELARVYEISRAQAARWANGQHLPHKPGDPRRPFEPDAIPVDRTLGPRRARFWAGGLNPGSLPTPLARRRARALLSQMPAGWSDQHQTAPLKLAEPFASARGDGSDPVLGFLEEV